MHAIKRLMYALLSDALRCFQTYADAIDREGRRIFAEVEAGDFCPRRRRTLRL